MYLCKSPRDLIKNDDSASANQVGQDFAFPTSSQGCQAADPWITESN